MAHHTLKIEADYAMQKALGNKSFEVRRDDRNFKVGDTIQYVSNENPLYKYGGHYRITSITKFQQRPGFVVFGDKPESKKVNK